MCLCEIQYLITVGFSPSSHLVFWQPPLGARKPVKFIEKKKLPRPCDFQFARKSRKIQRLREHRCTMCRTGGVCYPWWWHVNDDRSQGQRESGDKFEVVKNKRGLGDAQPFLCPVAVALISPSLNLSYLSRRGVNAPPFLTSGRYNFDASRSRDF